jgi:hypothetical protein
MMALLIVLVLAVLLSQLQGLLLRSVGGVGGSFGVRAISQGCVGFIVEGPENASRIPRGDVEFQLGLFHFRYAVTGQDQLGQRPICIGQDLWRGE